MRRYFLFLYSRFRNQSRHSVRQHFPPPGRDSGPWSARPAARLFDFLPDPLPGLASDPGKQYLPVKMYPPVKGNPCLSPPLCRMYFYPPLYRPLCRRRFHRLRFFQHPHLIRRCCLFPPRLQWKMSGLHLSAQPLPGQHCRDHPFYCRFPGIPARRFQPPALQRMRPPQCFSPFLIRRRKGAQTFFRCPPRTPAPAF